MLSVLFYGNCQPDAIRKLLCLDPALYRTTFLPCYLTHYNESTFLQIVAASDIIITQSIQDNYNNKPYLSTSSVLKHAKKDAKIFLFDSCYFPYYYFDLTYVKLDGTRYHAPIDYHYTSMIECYKNELPVETYVRDYVENVDLRKEDELERIAECGLQSLYDRYILSKERYERDNVYVCSIHDFVRDNYKQKLLFYSVNHPTKYLFHYLCEEIQRHFGFPKTMNYALDPLDSIRCILYACIQKHVTFPVRDCSPLTNGISDVLSIAKLYSDTYRALDMSKLTFGE
jgi:hypothetical protein